MNELHESFYIPVELLATRSHIIFIWNNIRHISALSWQNQYRWRSSCALSTLTYTHKPTLPCKTRQMLNSVELLQKLPVDSLAQFPSSLDFSTQRRISCFEQWNHLLDVQSFIMNGCPNVAHLTCSTFSLSSWMEVRRQHISTFSLAISSCARQSLKYLTVPSRCAGSVHLSWRTSVCDSRSKSNSARQLYSTISFQVNGGHGGLSLAAWVLYLVRAVLMASDRCCNALPIWRRSLYPW